MRPNNRRWWRITIIGVHSLKPDQGPREQVFMITGFGVHDRTD